MKSYSERASRELRLRLEATVLEWPGVSAREMFGAPCYKVNGKVFAFLVNGGIVLTQLAHGDRQDLLRLHPSHPYEAGRRAVRSWISVEVDGNGDLAAVLPYLKLSYRAALDKS